VSKTGHHNGVNYFLPDLVKTLVDLNIRESHRPDFVVLQQPPVPAGVVFLLPVMGRTVDFKRNSVIR
jgi:hypothetical protein